MFPNLTLAGKPEKVGAELRVFEPSAMLTIPLTNSAELSKQIEVSIKGFRLDD